MTTQQNPTKKAYLKRKQKLFIKEYIDNYGHISNACKKVKINRSTFYEWKEDLPFKEAFEEAIETHNDTIEQRILRLALDGDKDMLKFWAKTKMKKRGFTDKFLEEDKRENSVMDFVKGLSEDYEESLKENQ
jgi:hypothetical protein